jgi:hypothetical protein
VTRPTVLATLPPIIPDLLDLVADVQRVLADQVGGLAGLFGLQQVETHSHLHRVLPYMTNVRVRPSPLVETRDVPW